MEKKIYRTVIRFEILSDEPLFGDNNGMYDLSRIDEITKDGDCSGMFLEDECTDVVLSGKEAADAVMNQGSDPSFFQMDEEGNEIEDDIPEFFNFDEEGNIQD